MCRQYRTIDCPGVVQDSTYDLLNGLDSFLVYFCRIVVRYCVLCRRAIDFRWRSVSWAVLWAARHLMLIPSAKFIYVTRHGNIKVPLIVIPIERDTAVQLSLLIY